MKALLKKLDTIIDLLLADREERRQEKELKVSAENDARLIEYAKSKKKLMPTGGIYTSNELGERPMNIGGDLIPTNLSPMDRQLLREFYNSD